MRLNKGLRPRIGPQPGWGSSFFVTWFALIPVLVGAALLFAPVPVVFGQVIEVPPGVLPEPINDNDAMQMLNAGRQAELAPPSAPEIPFFTYEAVASRDGHTYEGSGVGGSPFSSTTNNKTTTVKFVIVPVVLKFNFGGGEVFTFSPTASDPGCLGTGNTALNLTQRSPLFHPVSFTMNGVNVGTTTYPDAFRRAEFFKDIGASYHLAFSVTTVAAQTVTLAASGTSPANASVYLFSGQCGDNTGTTNIPGGLGVVNINTFDPIAQGLISKLSLNASEFPFFVLYNSALSLGDSANKNNCCAFGYHQSETGVVTNPGQTYGVADFDGRDQTLFSGVADLADMTHEVDEWINDPSGFNLVPAWGHIGQQSGCQDNLEVGDPLTGTFFPSKTLNGFTYHLQELAFISWFYGKPSIGTGGLFSDNRTFKTDAGAVCH
jgi:hypothetical protein